MKSSTPMNLIDHHCACLEGCISLDSLSPLQLNASHEWIRLGLIGNAGDVNSDYQETQGFRIHLAMDVLNTVATCTGFDPRSSFWQSLLLRLSPLTPQDKRYAWAPFDHDLFSRFELEFDAAAYGSNNSLPRLEQLWMEIFAPNERFCRQRDQILASILHETMRPIPPLRFRLVFLHTAVTKASWMDAVVRLSERLSQDVEVVMRDKVLDQKQLGSLPLATLVSPPMVALRDVAVCLPLIGKVGSYEFLHANETRGCSGEDDPSPQQPRVSLCCRVCGQSGLPRPLCSVLSPAVCTCAGRAVVDELYLSQKQGRACIVVGSLRVDESEVLGWTQLAKAAYDRQPRIPDSASKFEHGVSASEGCGEGTLKKCTDTVRAWALTFGIQSGAQSLHRPI